MVYNWMHSGNLFFSFLSFLISFFIFFFRWREGCVCVCVWGGGGEGTDLGLWLLLLLLLLSLLSSSSVLVHRPERWIFVYRTSHTLGETTKAEELNSTFKVKLLWIIIPPTKKGKAPSYGSLHVLLTLRKTPWTVASQRNQRWIKLVTTDTTHWKSILKRLPLQYKKKIFYTFFFNSCVILHKKKNAKENFCSQNIERKKIK